jgi:hypothetical protein
VALTLRITSATALVSIDQTVVWIVCAVGESRFSAPKKRAFGGGGGLHRRGVHHKTISPIHFPSHFTCENVDSVV